MPPYHDVVSFIHSNSFVGGSGITVTPQQRREVVNIPSVRRHIRCGTDRPWAVVWKRIVSSSVSVEQQIRLFHRDDPATTKLRWRMMVQAPKNLQ